MYFWIVFKSGNDEFKLHYKTYDTDFGLRWADALREQCLKDNKVREKDRLYNFPNGIWDEEKIVTELNECIAIINKDTTVIHHNAFVGMPQDQLNHLHHYFENLRGGVLSPTEFWESSDEEVCAALEKFNIVIHRAENFYRSVIRPVLYPRIVCTFNDRIRYDLTEEDYQHFTLVRKFGEAHINYCEVGKPLNDVFIDGDDVVGDDNIRPLRYYSSDFQVCYHSRGQANVDAFLERMNQWWDENEEHLTALGFQKNDPKNSIGSIAVAEMITVISEQELVDTLSNYLTIDRIEIDE